MFPKMPAAQAFRPRSDSSIHINPAHKGLLHEKLGVPQGQPIPEGKIEAAEDSSSPSLKKEAVFAENAKGWRH